MNRDSPTLSEIYGPGADNYEPSALEEDVLGVLEDLDIAKIRAKDVLIDIFMRLIAARLPIGIRIELRQSRIIRGKLGQGSSLIVEVTKHHIPEINLDSPESTRVRIESRPVLKNDRLSKERIEFYEPVLGYEFIYLSDSKQNDRDRLVELVSELTKGE